MTLGEHAAGYLRGTAAALRDDVDAAIEAFERVLEGDPSSLPAQLGLLDALARSGRIDSADRIAEQLVAREPPESAALTAVARLREQQGQPSDAAALLARADLGRDLSAYALYLRVLIEAGRFEEALLEAERGLGWELARPYALLAKGLSLLHFGDHAGASATLEELDPTAFAALISDWAAGVRAARKADEIRRMLEPVLKGEVRSETATALANELA